MASNTVSIRSSRLALCNPTVAVSDISDTLKALASRILATNDPAELGELRKDVAWAGGPFILDHPEVQLLHAVEGGHTDAVVKRAARDLLDDVCPRNPAMDPIEGVLPFPTTDKPTFRRELAKLLNRFGKDTACDTTDYQLAEFVEWVLAARAATK